MPFFSVIIPLYNKEFFVENTIKSVLNQSFTDFELIIINDGSTDNSEQKILGFTDKRIQYYSKKNKGVSITRNFGISKAKSDYICFLDADDYWYTQFLEVMHNYIQKLPEQKVFTSAILIETLQSTFPAQYSIKKTNDYDIVDYFEASSKKSAIWTSAVTIHKSVFENVGCFDPKINKGEDTELWIRIGLQYSIVFIWEILAKYVYDESSISRNLNYFFEPYSFNKYTLKEKQNPKLKKFMDLNRCAAVIKCKLKDDSKTSTEIYKEIDLKNLNWKKRILIELPPFLLKLLVQFKNFLANIGFGKSVFR
jgi:glycosyltransferase involved in cell wall biosynthesis